MKYRNYPAEDKLRWKFFIILKLDVELLIFFRDSSFSHYFSKVKNYRNWHVAIIFIYLFRFEKTTTVAYSVSDNFTKDYKRRKNRVSMFFHKFGIILERLTERIQSKKILECEKSNNNKYEHERKRKKGEVLKQQVTQSHT